MKLDAFSKTVVSTWCWHQMFEGLGFKSDDIFVQVARNGSVPDGPPWLFVFLRTQGKEFVVSTGPANWETTRDEWLRFIAAYVGHEIPDSDLRDAYQAHIAIHSPVFLVTGLLDKGFFFPKATN